MLQLEHDNFSNIKLHPNILDVLFQHQGEIFTKLSDLKGLHFIDHVALYLINPDSEMVIFSSTPSVEFQLLAQGLWQYDFSFNPNKMRDGEMLFWRKAYHAGYKYEITKTKETAHHFTCGFSLLKEVNSFKFIYTFATRHLQENIEQYYQQHLSEILAIGNFGYKQLYSLYQRYSGYSPPFIETSCAKNHLKLVVNNQ